MNALIQQRVEEELARRAGQDEARQDEERRRLLAEATVRRQDSVISRAREVVELRQETNTDRASPAVWAAVRALNTFVTDINSHTQVGGVVCRLSLSRHIKTTKCPPNSLDLS